MKAFRWSVIWRGGAGVVAMACLATPGSFLLAQSGGDAPEDASGSSESAGASASEPQSRASVVETPRARWHNDRQIRVKGAHPRARVEVRYFANDLRRRFRRALFELRPGSDLQERSEWAVPIRIDLWGRVGDVVKGRWLDTDVELRPDDRFLIRVSVKLHDEFEEAPFRLELLRALLVEQMLAPYAGDPAGFPSGNLEPPDWLVLGFDQLLRHRQRGRPSALYEGVLESGQMLEPSEIFAEDGASDLDPVSSAVFRASASALVEALLEQPRGDEGLRKLLGDLPGRETKRVDGLLRQHFPGLRETEEGIEKWWALQLAALGQQQSLEYLDPEETDHRLTEALTVRFEATGGGGQEESSRPWNLFGLLGKNEKDESASSAPGQPYEGTLEQYPEFLEREGTKAKLDRCFARLQHLKRAGFPLYRPVLVGYEEVIERLAKGKTRDLDARFEELRKTRTQILDTMSRVEDYLNYFEATRAPKRSAAFDEYMEMKRKLEEAEPPKRTDRISRHLDALEAEFR